MDHSLPGFSVHGILQGRILQWVSMPSSRGSSPPKDQNCVSYPLLHWQAGSLPLATPGKPSGKESTCECRRHKRWEGSIPGSGRSPEVENGNALQYYCLENFTNRGAWWGHKRVGHDWARAHTHTHTHTHTETHTHTPLGWLPRWLSSKESACQAGGTGLIPGLRRPPGEGNGNPLQNFAWEIPWTEEPDGLQSMGS